MIEITLNLGYYTFNLEVVVRLLFYIVGCLVILGVIFSPFDSYANIVVSPFGGIIKVEDRNFKIISVLIEFEKELSFELELTRVGSYEYHFLFNEKQLIETQGIGSCHLNLKIVGEHDSIDNIDGSFKLISNDSLEYCSDSGKIAKDIFFKLQHVLLIKPMAQSDGHLNIFQE
jgi:hypothetical protein